MARSTRRQEREFRSWLNSTDRLSPPRAGTAAAIDEGLRSYMLKVYNYMGIGLVVTGLVAYFASAAAVTADGTRAHRLGRPALPAAR